MISEENLSNLLFNSGIINGTFKRVTTIIKDKEVDFIQNINCSKDSFNFQVFFKNTFIKKDSIDNLIIKTSDLLKTRNILKENNIKFFQNGRETLEIVLKEKNNLLFTVEELSEYLYEKNIIDNVFWRGSYKDRYVHLDSTESNKISISSEIYGKEACVFIRFKTEEDFIFALKNLDSTLTYEVLKDYKRIEFKVDYFKGWHWDE